MTDPIDGSIYGIRLEDDTEYRYVGLTTKSVSHRLSQHRKVAAAGRKTPFYDWLRKMDPKRVVADVLDHHDQLEDLGKSEVAWIIRLRGEGHRLLNLSEGGLGPTGVVWTVEMREAARARSTGREGLHRFGSDGPFYGKHHTLEQREKWSRSRKGLNSGASNPNYGKFGSDHPSFGRQMTEDARRQLSEQRTGSGNPNFGKTASAETRAKMSAVRKGRPMPSSKRSAHTRHHTNKNVYKPECQYCVDDARVKSKQKESEGDNVTRSG